MKSNTKNSLYIAALVFLLSPCSFAAKKYERDYQNAWCAEQKGQTEYVLPDRSRVDCLTDTHAIEFDWAKKWAEGIGQALYYSFVTGKRGGVVLIMEKESDYKHWHRFLATLQTYPTTPCQSLHLRPISLKETRMNELNHVFE